MPDKEIASGKRKELAKFEKNGKKRTFINFYYDIKEILEEQTAAYSFEEEIETVERFYFTLLKKLGSSRMQMF